MIRVEGLSVFARAKAGDRLRGKSPKRLLGGIDLDIAPGTLVGLIGDSGAGKSTLLRRLGLQLPDWKGRDRGDIYFGPDGRMVPIDGRSHDALLHLLSFVPQADIFDAEATVGETLRRALVFAGVADDEIHVVRDGAHHVECDDRDADGAHLSGGQRRRLAIARSLASEPRLLLLDEPTSGLDLRMAHEIMSLLASLCRTRKMTTVCTSHLPSTLGVCDRVLVMAPSPEGAPRSEQGGYLTEDLDATGYAAALSKGDEAASLYDGRRPLDAGIPRPAEDGGEGLPATGAGSPWHESWRQFVEVFKREALVWWRDTGAKVVTLAQPVVLACIVVCTQALHPTGKTEFIDFFLTICALWIGMSLAVRVFVANWKRYAVDELSGLGKSPDFFGKAAFTALLATGCAVLLFAVAWLVCWIVNRTGGSAGGAALPWQAVLRLGVLCIVAVSGAMIGLTISAVARSERAALFAMPLVLLPQVVFSKYATMPNRDYDEPTGPYIAWSTIWGEIGGLGNWLGKAGGAEVDWGFRHWVDALNFWASQPMSSRHAAIFLESMGSEGSLYWGDLWALVGLALALLVVAAAAYGLNCNRALSLIR